MATEIENLKEYKRTCEKALADTANPLHIAEECLMNREKRQGIDLVNDDVEKSLIKEVEVIKKCQMKMKKVLDKAYVQLKMDRAAQHALEIDAKDKHHAQGLDDRMQQLRNSSAGVGYMPGIENIDNTITIPESWARYTQENIARSQKERAASERLRGEIDSTLRQCANDMWNNFNAVNNSFNTRVRETTDARNKLQAHLQKTMQEIFDMERNIALLRKAIEDKEDQRGALQRPSHEIPAERGERDPRVSEDPEGAPQVLRALSGPPHEDQGHTGARHLRQGQLPQDRLLLLHGHAQRLPHGPQSRTHIPDAHLLVFFYII